MPIYFPVSVWILLICLNREVILRKIISYPSTEIGISHETKKDLFPFVVSMNSTPLMTIVAVKRVPV